MSNELVSITLKNMFGNGAEYDKYFYIPSESKVIVESLLTNYSYIYDLFKTENIKNNYNDGAIDEVINYLNINFLKPINYIFGYTGKHVLDVQKRITKDTLQTNLIKKGTANNESTFSILYLILYFSFFKFVDGDLSDYHSAFVNDGIYELKTGVLDDERKTFYVFSKPNRFFNMMNAICGKNWISQNSLDILTTGYYKKASGKYQVVFESENDIIDFIYDSILSANTAINIELSNDSNIVLGSTMLLSLTEIVIKLFKDNVLYYERETQGNDKGRALCNGEIKLAVKSSNKYFERYVEIFEYGYAIVKNYILALSKDSSTKKEDIASDEHLKKIVNTLIGADNNLKFKESYKTDIFDKDGIFNYWKSKINFPYTSINNLKFSSTNLDLNSISKSNQSIINKSSVKANIKNEGTAVQDFSSSLIELTNKYKQEPESFNFPLQFYEVTVYNGFNSNMVFDGKNALKNQIDSICRISGNILSKLAFFCVFKVPEAADKGYSELINFYTPTYNLEKKFTFNNSIVNINGTKYSDYETIYKTLGELVEKEISKLLDAAVKGRAIQDAKEDIEASSEAYDEYLKSRLANGYYTEEDFFYINDGGNSKRLPVNSFVEVEFNVPECYDDNGKIKIRTTWLPVSSVRSYNPNGENEITVYTSINDTGGIDKTSPLHAGTYFNSFELEDKAGVKEITLSLKSSNDMNLERIIYRSLALENQIKILKNDNSNPLSNIEKILNNSEANFRIRFGYRDVSVSDANSGNTAISTSDVTNNDFINRINLAKPVQVYPWTYFKITGLDSSIKDGEDEYIIKGVSSGSYMLSSMSLCGVSSNFSKDTNVSNEDFYGSPRNVIGKLAKWIFIGSSDVNKQNEKDLSTAKLCFLGDEKGTIITDFDNINNEFKTDYKYKLKSGENFKGGDLQSVEEFFFDGTKGNKLLAKNFNITNDTKTLSIKEILETLVKWLPDRIYYIGKSGSDTLAIYLPYETIYKIPDFFNTQPYKSEKLKFQIIEAEACIYEGIASPNDEYHNTYFIRMYYEGPSRTASKKSIDTYDPKNAKDYLRIYNYRSIKTQVIENIELSSNNAEFGNTVSSVTMLGCGAPIIFQFDNTSGTLGKDGYSAINGEKIDINQIEGDSTVDLGKFSNYFSTASEASVKPRIVFNNSNYIVSNTKSEEDFNAIASMCKNEASLFFSSMQNKLYTGEMTIMGDPFYYFDSSVEAGKYEIYLQMNRVEDSDSYKMTESRYTGIYFITGIKHSIDADGKFTTTLSITKRIFGSNSGKNNK